MEAESRPVLLSGCMPVINGRLPARMSGKDIWFKLMLIWLEKSVLVMNLATGTASRLFLISVRVYLQKRSAG